MEGGPITDVQHYLYRTHGGRYMQYSPLKYSKDVYLIQIPPNLDQEEVIMAGNEWGATHQWSFRYFNIDEDAGEQPKWFRARLHIRNFPLDFWHRDFIQYACAGFGEVRHIEEQCIPGNDCSLLALDLICIDPRRIPLLSTLPFGNKWKEMHIHIASWEYNHWVPEDAKLTVEEQRDIMRGLNNIADLAKETLNAAHNKLQSYLITPDSPTPPASPAYFSDDALEMPHGTEDPQHTVHNHMVMTTKDPQTYYANSPSHLMHTINSEQATSVLGEQPTLTPLYDKACMDIRIGDICITQGFTNHSCQSEKKDEFQRITAHGDFQKFSMEMVCVGQIKVLQAVLTYPNQKDIGKGELIQAVNQPWYAQWEIQRITTHEQRDTTVQGIFDEQQGVWREDQIRKLLGDTALSQIQQAASKPKPNSMIPDRLIWIPSKTGRYTVKEGYEFLRRQSAIPHVYDEAKNNHGHGYGHARGCYQGLELFCGGAFTMVYQRLQP